VITIGANIKDKIYDNPPKRNKRPALSFIDSNKNPINKQLIGTENNNSRTVCFIIQ